MVDDMTAGQDDAESTDVPGTTIPRRTRRPVTKLSITLPTDLLIRMRAAVAEGRADSISALIAESVDETLDDVTFGEWVAERLRQNPLSAEDEAWVEHVLSI